MEVDSDAAFAEPEPETRLGKEHESRLLEAAEGEGRVASEQELQALVVKHLCPVVLPRVRLLSAGGRLGGGRFLG